MDDDDWAEGDGCELCGEDETDDDPIGHFRATENGARVMAHGQCGEDAGLQLA